MFYEIDLAESPCQKALFAILILCGRESVDPQNGLILAQALEGLSFPRNLIRTSARHFEDAANGPAIIDALQRDVLGIVAVKPDGGKVASQYCTVG